LLSIAETYNRERPAHLDVLEEINGCGEHQLYTGEWAACLPTELDELWPELSLESRLVGFIVAVHHLESISPR